MAGQAKPLALQQMTSSTPMDKAEPWWRPCLGPGVAAIIIGGLVISLVIVGVTAFNSLKGDIRDLSLDIRASETRLREDMKEFRTEIKGDLADFRADNRALNDKLDRILEIVLADKS